MATIILACCGAGETAHIVQDEDGNNRVFGNVQEADDWSWDNAGELGDTFRFVDLDD